MIRDHYKAPPRFERFGGCCQHFFQCFHFLIHFNAECLKNFRQFFLLPFASEKRLDDFQKLADSPDRLSVSGLHDDECQFAAVLQFTVQIEDVCEPFFFVCVDDVGGG